MSIPNSREECHFLDRKQLLYLCVPFKRKVRIQEKVKHDDHLQETSSQ